MSKVIMMQEQETVNLAQYDNSWYNSGSKVKIILWMVVSRIFFNNTLAIFTGLKCWLLRCFGASVGVKVMIKPSVNIKYPWFLHIGDNSWIGEKVWIDNLTTVTIGKNVCISQGAFLLTGNHNYSKLNFELIVKQIVIQDGAWIGAKAIVGPGVTCKRNSVLSVGSVATKDLEADSIYAGNSAIKIRDRIMG